jgi:hypothetical protein
VLLLLVVVVLLLLMVVVVPLLPLLLHVLVALHVHLLHALHVCLVLELLLLRDAVGCGGLPMRLADLTLLANLAVLALGLRPTTAVLGLLLLRLVLLLLLAR